MKGISENEIFSANELELFHAASDVVSLLPEVDQHGALLRCHEVARIVGGLLRLPVMDGRYEYGCEHSWCVIKEANGRGFTILDPYAVGRLPLVQLVCVTPTMPNRYFPEALRKDIREDVVERLLDYFYDRKKNNGSAERSLPVQVPLRREGC